MKKYYFLLVVLMAILTSCTNDDIGTYNIGKFTYNINTQPVFDDFNATSTIKNRFLSGEYGDYHLGVYTYIYDKDGNLVDNKVSYTKTFGTETYEFTLKSGSYTAVSVEMIVDKDDDYKSPRFELKGTEKLSTIEVAYRTYKGTDGAIHYYSTSLWYQCIGVAVNTFSVGASFSTFSAVPKPIGVIINCSFFNFNNSTYDYLLLRTKNAPIGRYLDPTKSGDDRFKYESYNEGNNVTVRENIHKATLDEEEGMDVYLLEEGADMDCRLGARHYPDNWYTNGRRNSFEDGNTYYAGLYYIGGTESGGSDLYGGIFDNINDYNSWYNVAKTMSQATSLTALIEPYTTWGSSVSAVQSNMTGYTLTVGSAGKAVLASNGTSYYIQYSAQSPVAGIQYEFSSETTGLTESDVFYIKTAVSQDKILELLNAQYTFITEYEGSYMYMTKDEKSYVMMIPLEDYFVVGYVDPSSISSSNASAFKNMERAMKQGINDVLSINKLENAVMTSAFSPNVIDSRLCRMK